MKILLFILLSASLVFGGTKYYIDPGGNDTTGDGSIGTPWATWAKALATVTTAGDTIHVNAGTYTETTELGAYAVASLSAGVSIEGPTVDFSYPDFTTSPTAIIQANGANPTTARIIWAASSTGTAGNQSIKYIKFVSYNGGDYYKGIEFQARHTVTVSNCEFTDWRDFALIIRGQENGETQAPANYAANIIMSDNKFTNCGEKIAADVHGAIQIGGLLEAKIYNNYIDNYEDGVSKQGIKYTQNGWNKGYEIYNNTILTGYSNPGSSDWRFAMELWNSLDTCKIHDNVIQGTVNIDDAWYDSGNCDYSVAIYNNSIAWNDGGQNRNTSNAISFDDSLVGIRVYNNHIDGTHHGVGVSLNTTRETINGFYVYNNLFTNMGDSIGTGKALYIGSNNAAQTLDNISFINNTIVAINDTALQHMFKITSIFDTGADNIEISNNICVNTRGKYIQFDDGGGGAAMAVNIKNNDNYSAGSEGVENENSVATITTSGVITTDPLLSATNTLTPNSPCIDGGLNLGAAYDDALLIGSTWPNGVLTADQDDYNLWEIGAFIFKTAIEITTDYIVIDGLDIRGGDAVIRVTGNNNTIKNSIIDSADATGIALLDNDNSVEYNLILNAAGDAVQIDDSTGNTIYNNVIYGNDTGIDANIATTAKNNIVYNNTTDDININTGITVTGGWNIYEDAAKAGAGTYSGTSLWATDPLFTTAGSDFTLTDGSPAINAGVSVGLVLDYAGNTVPFEVLPDIGAYEYQLSTSTGYQVRFRCFPDFPKYKRH